MKRFLSLLMALTLVVSLFTVNVMAANIQRTMTLSADKTTGLKAGDTVTVSVAIDTSNLVTSAEYILVYDTSAFEIDTTKGWEIDRDSYENFLEPTWYTDIMTNKKNNWCYYFGGTIPTYAVDGEIYVSYTSTQNKYIEEKYATTDDVIGKFILKVKNDAPDGTYTFTLKGPDGLSANTMDTGENVPLNCNFSPLTVTVGSGAAGDDVVVPNAAASDLTNGVAGIGGEIYDNATMTTVEYTDVDDIVKVGVLFIPTAVLNGADLNLNTTHVANAEYAGELNLLGNGTYTLKAALRGIPRKHHEGINITSRAYAIYGDDEVKYADAKAGEIIFAATAE